MWGWGLSLPGMAGGAGRDKPCPYIFAFCLLPFDFFLLSFLYRAQQWKLIFLCQRDYLRDLCFCNLICKNACDANALLVNLQHDSYRLVLGMLKDRFQNQNDEVHCRVIVIVEQNLEER